MKCTKCDKEAEYIVDGQSVCLEHKGDSNDRGPEEETEGHKLAGM